MFQVFAKVHTPVGIFTGSVSDILELEEDALEERNKIQDLICNISSFTFFSDTTANAEITLGSEVIKNSVFVLEVYSDDPEDKE